MPNHNKRGFERMILAGGPGDLPWLVEALNDRGDENDRLRELVKNLNEISFGEVDGKVAAKVDHIFRGIRWSPLLHERNGNLSVIWLPREGDTQEAGIVANLAALGLLVRIHRCSRCGRWFAAKRERQPYSFNKPCSDNCRISIHRKKPEIRKKRRTYMRTYYHENLSSTRQPKPDGLKRHGKRTKRAA